MIKRLAEVLAQRQDRLPRPEPEVFSAHTLIYPMWKKSFETFIERKTKDSSELLCYLGKYTSGESVSGILSLNSVSTVRESITGPRSYQTDGHSLRKLTNFLQHCLMAMNTVEYLNMLNDQKKKTKDDQKAAKLFGDEMKQGCRPIGLLQIN